MARTDIPNVSYPFIKFEIASQSLSWDANGRPDYFCSLSNQRYVDQANVATINIKYAPRYGEDPNKIEAALSNSGGVCRLQYGLAGQRSAVYLGNIYDYKTSFDQGFLNYKIDLISRSAAFTSNTVADRECVIKDPKELQTQELVSDRIPEKVHEDLGDDIDPRAGSSYAAKLRQEGYSNPYFTIEELAEIFEDARNNGRDIDLAKYLENNKDSDTKDLVTDITEGTPGRSLYILGIMRKIVEAYCEGYYVFDVKASDKNFDYKSKIDTLGKSPLEALKLIAETIIDTAEPDNSYYVIVVDDINTTEGGKGRIYMKRMGGKRPTAKVYTFDWNCKDGDVLSWNPSYTGHAALFSNQSNILHQESDKDSKTEEDESDDSKKKDTSSDGDKNSTITTDITDGEVEFNKIETSKAQMKSEAEKIYKTWMSNDAWDKAVAAAQAIKDINGFLQAVNYPYNATLEVLGRIGGADEITLCDNIQVNPYINGQLHHSAGTYQVIGITDNIGPNGFTTTLSLEKCTNEEVSEQGGEKKVKGEVAVRGQGTSSTKIETDNSPLLYETSISGVNAIWSNETPKKSAVQAYPTVGELLKYNRNKG